MISDIKIEKLIEKYYKDYLKLNDYTRDKLSEESKTYFIKLFEFCQNENRDFPNLDFIAATNTANEYDANFLFTLCDEAFIKNPLTPLDIMAFDEEKARQFHQAFVSLYLSDISLTDLHDNISNYSIADKYKQRKLGFTEWLTEVDLRQLGSRCELQNLIITNCNFTNPEAAISNLGTALHFKREDFQRNHHKAKQISIPLLLETGTILASSELEADYQGSHWVGCILNVDLEKKTADLYYMNSLYDIPESRNFIADILARAISFHASEETACGDEKEYCAFKNFEINIKFIPCLEQPNYWSCGYYAFKNISEMLPPSDNKFLKGIQTLPYELNFENPNHFASRLRNVVYQTLLNDYALEEQLNNAQQRDFYFNNFFKAPVINTKSDDSNWQEIYKYCIAILTKFMNDESKGSKAKCLSLINHIENIPKSFNANQKINCLIDYLNLQIAGTNQSMHANHLWQQNIDELQVIAKTLKLEIDNFIQKDIKMSQTNLAL